jgi:hypothetical protein
MSGEIIHLKFPARAMAEQKSARPISFTLEGKAGNWSLRPDSAPLSPAELVTIADSLREIARGLTEQAHALAGIKDKPCLAEFVLYQGGGIDHWISRQVSSAEERFSMKLGLRNAIWSLK